MLVIKSLPPNDDMGDNGNADARHCKRYVTTKIARIPLRWKIRARSTVYRPPPVVLEYAVQHLAIASHRVVV